MTHIEFKDYVQAIISGEVEVLINYRSQNNCFVKFDFNWIIMNNKCINSDKYWHRDIMNSLFVKYL